MCYRLVEEVSKLPGNFDTSIDCTYVLIMEDSPREETLRKHVETAHITSRVVYQYNKGYKKCHKNLKFQKPNYDLEHSLRNAFKDALSRGYERILVLEDDCEFDERIHDPNIIVDVNKFLLTNNPEVYTLGSFFPVINPFTVSNHQRLLLNFSSHAIIYNKTYMKWFIDNECILGHVDLNTNRCWSKFTYKLPLAYQKTAPTENTKHGWSGWYELLDALVYTPAGININVQPGYDLIKTWSDIIVVFIIIWITSNA